jgi:hypothetical protein
MRPRGGTTSNREREIGERVARLIENFESYLCAFDQDPAFKKSGQLENHTATIQLRRKIGNASDAAREPSFQSMLYQTLLAWGIGQRASRLVTLAEFNRALEACCPRLALLDGFTIDLPESDEDKWISDVWQLIGSLHIVHNEAKLVPCTKAIHHLLPDLVVPMDREFTRTFFGWHVPEFQYQQEKMFRRAHERFAQVARATNPARFVGAGWRTSRTKILDNAIVAFCQLEGLPRPT